MISPSNAPSSDSTRSSFAWRTLRILVTIPCIDDPGVVAVRRGDVPVVLSLAPAHASRFPHVGSDDHVGGDALDVDDLRFHDPDIPLSRLKVHLHTQVEAFDHILSKTQSNIFIEIRADLLERRHVFQRFVERIPLAQETLNVGFHHGMILLVLDVQLCHDLRRFLFDTFEDHGSLYLVEGIHCTRSRRVVERDTILLTDRPTIRLPLRSPRRLRKPGPVGGSGRGRGDLVPLPVRDLLGDVHGLDIPLWTERLHNSKQPPRAHEYHRWWIPQSSHEEPMLVNVGALDRTQCDGMHGD